MSRLVDFLVHVRNELLFVTILIAESDIHPSRRGKRSHFVAVTYWQWRKDGDNVVLKSLSQTSAT